MDALPARQACQFPATCRIWGGHGRGSIAATKRGRLLPCDPGSARGGGCGAAPHAAGPVWAGPSALGELPLHVCAGVRASARMWRSPHSVGMMVTFGCRQGQPKPACQGWVAWQCACLLLWLRRRIRGVQGHSFVGINKVATHKTTQPTLQR